MKAVDETTGKMPWALLRAFFLDEGGIIEGTVEQIREAVSKYSSGCSTVTAKRALEKAQKEGKITSLGRGKGLTLMSMEEEQSA